jgi:predicted ATPase
MRALQDPEPGTTLKDDGSNAASVLRRIEGSRGYERMGGLLDLLLDDAPVEVHAMSIGPKETIEFIERGNGGQGRSLPAHSMSDGMLRFLGVLLAVYQKTPPSLIAVEEPESHVHPAAAEILFSALEEGTMQSQIVIATHSPEILDLKSLKEDQIRIVEMVSGKTIISAIGPQTKGIIRDRLFTAGELLSSNELRREDGVLDSREPELDIFKTEPAS